MVRTRFFIPFTLISNFLIFFVFSDSILVIQASSNEIMVEFYLSLFYFYCMNLRFD